VFSVKYKVLTPWWPWEQLLLGFVFFVRYAVFVKKQVLLLRQAVFAVRFGLRLVKTDEH
jgi:hypothetical protein